MAGEMVVRVVGGLTVSLADRVLPATEVGSRKARILLALLALRGEYVPMDRIVAAVWGDTPPRDPVANVATLVSRLRAKLGASAIDGGGTGYWLGHHVRLDLRDGADLVDQAEFRITGDQPALALMAARRAAQLLGHNVVMPEEADAAWAGPARVWHGDLLRRARHTIAEAALRVGDIRAASAAATAAVSADAFDEAACRILMRALHANGEPSRALLTYQRLRKTLAAELGVDPAPPTRDLYVAILQEASRDTATPVAG